MSTTHARSSGWSNGDDFTNNFISDLGPLLALFGEQVAKQFMSESIGWADNIIFAMGPLGIITAIVGAIRVGGPSWLKAIIGRARENRTVAEVELMSSTSHEVCELWNGQQIVRIMGSPEIRELIRIDREDKSVAGPTGRGENISTLTTLEQAIKDNIVSKVKESATFPWLRLSLPSLIETEPNMALKSNNDTVCSEAQIPQAQEKPRSKKNSNAPQLQCIPQSTAAPQTPIEKPASKRSAPNISLNIHDHSSRHELHAVAAAGTILQLSVLMYGGFVTYHPQLKYQKDGSDIATYAFPLMSIGTSCLVVGLLICAHVIESSTKEDDYEVNEADAHILWLQKNATVGDQEFGSYAIFAKDKRNLIKTSRRNIGSGSSEGFSSSTGLEILSSLGTTITLCGFFGQFVGLRAMHWSVSFTQLGVTLVMMILRAWVRRGLAKRPYVQILPPKHEIDWLATRSTCAGVELWRESEPQPLSYWKKAWHVICRRSSLSSIVRTDSIRSTKCFDWEILTGEEARAYGPLVNKVPSDGTMRMHQVVQCRKELGWLTKWPGPGLGYATSLAASIEIVMNTLMAGPSFGKELFWTMCAPRGELVYLKVDRPRPRGKWSADLAEIEATLSLWLYAVREKEQASYDSNDKSTWLKREILSKRQGLRLLGSSTKSSRRDLKWWIGNGVASIFQVGMQSISDRKNGITNTGDMDKIHCIEHHQVVGFRGLQHPETHHHPAPENLSELMIYKNEPFPEDLTSELSSSEGSIDPIMLNPESTFTTLSDSECPQPSLAVISDAPIGLLFAQDMFSSFMWAVAKTVDHKDMALLMGPATVQQAENAASTEGTTWEYFTLKNSTLLRVVHETQRTGLGNQEEIYLSIIPPLSANKKLPEPSAVVELAREEARKKELVGQWENARDIYLWTYRACMSFEASHTVRIQATTALAEFIRSISTAAEERQYQNRAVESSRHLEEMRSALMNELIRTCPVSVRRTLAEVYVTQCRVDEGSIGWCPERNITAAPGQGDISENLEAQILGRTALHEAVLHGKLTHPGEHYSDFHGIKAKDVFGWTPLHYAAGLGDQGSLERLLDNHADPNSIDNMGWTPLHYIIWAGHADTFLRLLCRYESLNVNAQGRDGLTPLHCAEIRNNVGMTKFLLELGAKMRILDNTGKTPLHWAAFYGSNDVVEILSKDAYLDLRDEYGRTPLHLAAIKGKESIVAALLNTPVTGEDIRDRDGMTPILLAAKHAHENVVKVLLKPNQGEAGFTTLHIAIKRENLLLVKELLAKSVGADIEVLTPTGFTPLHLATFVGNARVMMALIDAGSIIDAKSDKEGLTALHIASQTRNHTTLKLLIQAGADKNLKENNCRTALHLAVLDGHIEAVEALLDMGTEIYTQAQDKLGYTALHWAVWEGRLEISKRLIGFPGLHVKDLGGLTCLHRAALKGDSEVVDLLLHAGVEKDLTDENGRTALYMACENGMYDTVRSLIDAGANLEMEDRQGRRAIHTAAAQGNASIQLLLKADVQKDITDNNGLTPLHLAILGQHSSVVQLLINSGASIGLKDANQRTLLHWAAEQGCQSITELFGLGMDLEAKDNGDLHLYTWRLYRNKIHSFKYSRINGLM